MRVGALLLLPAMLVGEAALAQASECKMPRLTSVSAIAPDGPAQAMAVTGYTLALSWSPEFCKPRAGGRAHALQCGGRNGRFGMVAHGLWPEGARGWPQWCNARSKPTGADITRQLCISPSARLVARQWAKHGSCSGWTPASYYRITTILYRSLRWPDFARLSREPELTAGTLRTAFAAANPGIRAEAVGVKLSERGWLEELRLCYGLNFRPTRCDRRQLGPRDGVAVSIWRGG